MTKSDKSIHNICIASIKRSTIKPYNFKWTQFFESNSDFQYSELLLDMTENELIICSTIIDADNYSILTTKRLLTKLDGQEKIGVLKGATDKQYGDFKGHKDKLFTCGLIQLESGENVKYLIETGNASMIMIHGVRTLLKTSQMSNDQIENVTRNWGKLNQQ